MPRISEFYGIVIEMHWDDHWPPHFHATHAEYNAAIAIDGQQVLKGRLPPGVLSKVRKWAALHEEELLVNWELARGNQPLNPIAPLV